MTSLAVIPGVRIRTDLVTSLLSVWFTVGLMLDAWAHNNVPGLETFFTPWHAAFYSGFVAVGLWIAWTGRAGIRDGRWQPAAMPRAYPAAILALGGFAVAAFGDFLWHKIFGIEQSINILFSPTHLGLITAMMVIVTTPLRSFWSDPQLPAEPGFRRALPAVLSVSLAATLVLLFVQYANVLLYGPSGVVYSLSGGDNNDTAFFAASLAVTNLVLIVPLLVLAHRCRLPVGTATVLYAVVAGLGAAITGFEHPALAGSLVVAGVVVDGLSLFLRPGPTSGLRRQLFAFLAPALTWTIYLASAAMLSTARVASGARPEAGVELWTGAPIVQGLVGVLIAGMLALVARREPRPADEPATA